MTRLTTTAVAAALVTSAALGACSSGGSAEALCELVRTDRTLGTVLDGFDPTDTDRALDQLRSVRVALGELRDAAPDDVRDDLSVEIDYVEALIEGLDVIDPQDPAAAVEVARQVTDEHPQVDRAAANLEAFSQERCDP